MERYWKITWKIWEIYVKNGLITGHLSYLRGFGSIGNEFAASIWGSLSPPRSSRASKVSKMCQKNWVTQFLRYQFLSIQDSNRNICFYSDFYIFFNWFSIDFLIEFLMDFTSSGSSELGRDLQKNGPFFPRSGSSKLGRTLQKSSTMIYGKILENYRKNTWKIWEKWVHNGP